MVRAMTQRIGGALEPLLIVPKKKVGETQPGLCMENVGIQRAYPQDALKVVNCCSVVAQDHFRPPASATVEPKAVPPSETTTLAPASAVPHPCI